MLFFIYFINHLSKSSKFSIGLAITALSPFIIIGRSIKIGFLVIISISVSSSFISFKERRIIIRGMLYAYYVAKDLELDIIHTHTEFGLGFLGKQVSKALKIPCIHTFHTMYEDYLHYIANGKLIRPVHVKQFSKLYMAHMNAIVCPSQRVVDKLEEYEIEAPKFIIPTGIDVSKFIPEESVTSEWVREKYGIQEDETFIIQNNFIQ